MKEIKPTEVQEAEILLQGLLFGSDPQQHLEECAIREKVVDILSGFYHSEKFDQFGFQRYQLRQKFMTKVVQVSNLHFHTDLYISGNQIKIWFQQHHCLWMLEQENNYERVFTSTSIKSMDEAFQVTWLCCPESARIQHLENLPLLFTANAGG